MAGFHRMTRHAASLLAGYRRRAEARRQTHQAITELRAYSDAQLTDLGIVRPMIGYAVRYGRPGIDNVIHGTGTGVPATAGSGSASTDV